MSRNIPSFDELPNYKNFTGCAWGVWGEDDQLGTVGMLTPEVVQRAAKEEIRFVAVLREIAQTNSRCRTGHSISLNWYTSSRTRSKKLQVNDSISFDQAYKFPRQGVLSLEFSLLKSYRATYRQALL